MAVEITIVVPAGKQRERIDVFLTHHIENATRAKVQQAIKAGNVTVNGTTVKVSYPVSPGETVHIVLPNKRTPTEAQPENIPLDIVFEDEYLIIVNKPAGMVTHPAYANYEGTLVNALLHHSHGKLSAVNAASTPQQFPRPGIVHRLDKDTSGLMVIAKDDEVHAALSKQFSSRTIRREYWAIVWGVFKSKRPKKSEGEYFVIEAPLGRSHSDRKKVAVIEDGKPATTLYKVLEEFQYLSLVQCKLKTGRTHQIRVHMSHIGHPVFGDPVYGGRSITGGASDGTKRREAENLLTMLPRQALHAKTIGFIHPITGKELFFESELPEDMSQLLDKIR